MAGDRSPSESREIHKDRHRKRSRDRSPGHRRGSNPTSSHPTRSPSHRGHGQRHDQQHSPREDRHGHRSRHERRRTRSRSAASPRHHPSARDSRRDQQYDHREGHDRQHAGGQEGGYGGGGGGGSGGGYDGREADGRQQFRGSGGFGGSGGYDRRGPPPPFSGEPPQLGSLHRGTVVSVRAFGVFVRCQTLPKDALVHASQVDEQITLDREDPDDAKIQALTWSAPPGSEVWVKLVEMRDDGGGNLKLGCSMKAVDQSTGEDLDPNNALQRRGGGAGVATGAFAGGSTDPPEVNSIHEAVVEKVAHFGIFVKMKGFAKSGLVYSSQVSDYLDLSKEDSPEEKAAALASVVAVGEQIWVKVVEVSFDDERGPKVGCSMKVADQKNGNDLDPGGLKYRPRGEGGGFGGRQQQKDNVAVTDATVEWGHLGADIKKYGDKDYEMVGGEADVQMRSYQQSGSAEGGAGPSYRGSGDGNAPGSGANAGSLGRGRSATQPAWMTQGVGQTAVAPGSSPTANESDKVRVSTVEEALAIIQALGGKHGKRSKDKKKSKDKKHKKEKKEKKEKKSKDKKHRKQQGSSSSDDSD